MAEIKSTLELALERTRHLTMSAQEKAQQQLADFQKRIQGLLQQYGDHAFTVDAFNDRLTALQHEFGVTDPQLVMDAIIDRLDPDQDNQNWLALLLHLAPAACPPIEAALTTYREARAGLWQTCRENLLDQFETQYHISGPAVVPNVQRDAFYQKARTELHNVFLDTVTGTSKQAD